MYLLSENRATETLLVIREQQRLRWLSIFAVNIYRIICVTQQRRRKSDDYGQPKATKEVRKKKV